MRVAVLHNLPPGGALRFVVETTTRLAELVEQVTVVTWGDEPAIDIDGIEQLWVRPPPVRLPPPLHPFADLFRSYVGSRRAARAAASIADVALVHPCRWAQAPQALRTITIPTVYMAQEGRRRTLEPGYRPSGDDGRAALLRRSGTRLYDRIAGAMDRRAFNAATIVLANSSFTAENLERGYGRAADVVELGVDTTRFSPNTGVPRRNTVTLVGALDATKRADLAIESVALIDAAERPDVRLIYNRCHPPFRERIEGMAAAKKVRIVHREQISDAELVDEYRMARAVLAIADNEPFGLTVPEANACGTPVVATRSGGYMETVTTGVNGILVEPDPPALADAIRQVVTGSVRFEPTALAELARGRWSWDRCTSNIVTQLERSRRA